MNTYLSLFLAGGAVWAKSVFFFAGLSAMSGAVFVLSTIPLVAVLSIKAVAIVAAKFS